MERLSKREKMLDRRVQRTQAALSSAMLQLIIDRGWDDIDVRSLCEKANIGRSTFYQHYASKEDLLKNGLTNLATDLLTQVESKDPLNFVLGLLEHVYEQKHVFRALVGRRSGRFVQERFLEMIVDLVWAGFPSKKNQGWKSAASVHYLAGALLELITWWLNDNRPQKPKEIMALYEQLSHPILSIALNNK